MDTQTLHDAIRDELPADKQARAIAAADAAYQEACNDQMTFRAGIRHVIRAIAKAAAE